jgi:hypothetical protein
VGILNGVQTGIAYDPLLPGLVPLFEEWEAAAAHHYTPGAWDDLDSWTRALCVAHLRLRRAVEMHQTDAVDQAMKAARPSD